MSDEHRVACMVTRCSVGGQGLTEHRRARKTLGGSVQVTVSGAGIPTKRRGGGVQSTQQCLEQLTRAGSGRAHLPHRTQQP